MNRPPALPSAVETIVVGGGTAGCVVAARLAAAGREVLVLEAGPDYGPLDGGAWPAELLDATTLPTSHDWGYRGRGAGGQALTYDRARVMGGCSAHNGCTQSVGWAGDYDRWADGGCPGWDAASLTPLFATVTERLHLRHYEPGEVQPFHREFTRAAAAGGIPDRDDLDDLNAGPSVGCAPVNVRELTRVNTAFGYLDAVRARTGLAVAGEVQVDRIHFAAGHVDAVEVSDHGRSSLVRAREIVLAAGAYGSPEILLRSGLGPGDHLRAFGIPIVADVPGVGANLHDHPAVQLEFAATEQLRRDLDDFATGGWMPEEQSLIKVRSPVSDGPFDLHIYPWVEPDATMEHGWRCVVAIAQLRPRSRGTVRLRSASPRDLSVVAPAFLSDPGGADLASLRWGLRWTLENVVSRMGRYLGPAVHEPLPGRARDDGGIDDGGIDDWIRRNHTHYWHPAGSCAMGRADDPSAVVDHQGRVFGVTGLRVADASIFPDIPRATPAWPTAVVGERIARFMTTAGG